jgi:hypothetical protein
MSLYASTRRARFQLEHLEDRRTPSALLGGPSAHLLAHHGGPHAAAAVHVRADHGHAVPIKLSVHITADGSSMQLRGRGFGTHLGHWTTQGHIDNIVSDAVADRIVASGTATIVTAGRAKLFVSILVAWQNSTRQGDDTVTFTGGTGNFAGASGRASLDCRVTEDPTSPLTFVCDGKGLGTLVLARR